eukprot:TRINITY_DN3054_c0_g1_i13.p1 TRINITY_DN3054_c0_g1~~TRINITY_DN3054_c0_g1_i13.p1  ORF type:complete len:460 (-),score=105.97 TRINITY_DN3054_c0_g1_i13:349-1653(-)
MPEGVIISGDGSQRRRSLLRMPELQTEAFNAAFNVRRALRQAVSEGEGEGEGESEGEKEEDDMKEEYGYAPEIEGEGEGESEGEAEGEGEGEAEGEAEAEGEGGTAGGAFTDFFGEGACSNPIMNIAGAHAMINQDIVVASARGDYFRIQDSFTPSRSKPLPDVVFGGQDDITDAVGMQTEDGLTLIKYRRPLTVDDQNADYCIYDDMVYLAIWAYGQVSPNYSHQPPSSLEINAASNTNFYKEDELKFHGGGIDATSFDGRGSFGQITFFPDDAADTGTCTVSTLDGYDCMFEVLPAQYTLHWTVDGDNVNLAVEATTTGWVGIAWPETPNLMVVSEAVIGFLDDATGDVTINVFELTGKIPDLVVPYIGGLGISNESVEQTDGTTIVKFTVSVADAFPGEGPYDLLAAFSEGGVDALSYHGSTRTGFQLPSL